MRTVVETAVLLFIVFGAGAVVLYTGLKFLDWVNGPRGRR